MRAIPRSATKARRANSALLNATRTLVSVAKPAPPGAVAKSSLPRFTKNQVDQRKLSLSV
jgi:hypothetical protein